MAEKNLLKIHKFTNFKHKLSLGHIFIEPVISYDEFIDDLVLYKNHLICIFMNINKTVRKWGKNVRKTISIARYWIGYKIQSILHPWDKFSRLIVFSEGPP